MVFFFEAMFTDMLGGSAHWVMCFSRVSVVSSPFKGNNELLNEFLTSNNVPKQENKRNKSTVEGVAVLRGRV